MTTGTLSPPRTSDVRRGPTRARAVLIAIVYAAAGAAWMLGSEWMAIRGDASPSPGAALPLGPLAFVAISAMLLAWGLDRVFETIRRSAQPATGLEPEDDPPPQPTRGAIPSNSDFARAERLAHLGSWKWDLPSGKVTWSDELYRVFGVDPATFVPSNEAAAAMLHPADRARHADLVAKALAGEEVGPFECRLIRSGGEERVALASGFDVEFDMSGAPIRVLGTVMDITERKRAEQALRLSEAQFRAIASSTPDHIVMHDRDLRYVTVINPQLGLTEADMIGKTDYDFLAPAEAEKLVSAKRAVLETGQRLHFETSLANRKGGTEHFDGTFVPRTDSSGQIDGLIGYFQNVTERKRAEAALRESERRLATLMANLPGMAYRCGNAPGWPMVFVSEGCKTLTGYAAGAVMDDQPTFGDLIVPADRQPVWDAVQTALATQQPFELTYQIQAADGSLKWVWERGRGIFAADGPLLFLEGFVTDITQRKQAEDELVRAHRQRERAMRFNAALISAIPTPVFYKDRDGRYLGCNRAFAEMTGVTTEEVAGKTTHDLWPLEHAEIYHAKDLELMANPGQQTYESTLQSRDGTRRTVIFAKDVFRDEEGQPAGIIGAFLDITDRKRVEEALRDREELYSTIVNQAVDAIVLVEPASLRFVEFNTAAHEMMGHTREEFARLTVADLDPGLTVDRIRETNRRILADGFADFDGRLRHSSGEFRNVRVRCQRVHIKGTDFIAAMWSDTTERERLESQLRQAQKLEGIGQLAGGVAHDFNNILAAMMIHVGLLQMSDTLDEETRQALRDLDEEARRAAALVRQLLIFSRRSVLTIKPQDLNEIVANILKMLARVIGEDIQLAFDRGSGVPTIDADAAMLEQVVLNLVVNARDALPNGGRITLSTSTRELGDEDRASDPDRRAGRFACLSVADNGTGMDEATLKRIFEPFFTTKEPGKGTGLGLATVHGIVAQHQGWIEVESAVGRGTTFRVFLPAGAPAAASQELSSTEPPQRGRETVLLVEDEAALRKTMGRTLRTLGYRVHEAANGEEAIRQFDLHGPDVDLVFTDMVMPEGMTGLELTRRLRAVKPGLKAIICSGYSGDIVQAGAPDGPGVAFLPKPCEVRTLAATVRACLDSTPRADAAGGGK